MSLPAPSFLHFSVPPKKRNNSLTHGLTSLVLHRFLLGVGITLFGVFIPIYFYQLFQENVSFVLLQNILYYGLSFIVLPLGALLMNRIGITRSLMVGTLAYLFAFTFAALKGYVPLPVVVIGSFLFFFIHHVIYWVPFHTEFAATAPRKNLGEVLGGLGALTSIVGLIAPVIAGFTIERFGYTFLIFIGAIFILTSLWPLPHIKTIRETYQYTYRETYQVLFSKVHRTMFWVFSAQGAMDVVGTVLWPIFLYRLFHGSLVRVGINASLVIGVTIILQILIGYVIDRWNGKALLRFGITCYSLGWFLKAFVSSFTQVFFVGVYHNFALILMQTPMDAIMYTRAAQAGHYIDEFTVLRELAIAFGRASMLTLCFFMISSFGFASGFVLAGCATLVLNLITRVPRTYTV